MLHVNEHWTALRGQTQADLEGRPLDLLEVRVILSFFGGNDRSIDGDTTRRDAHPRQD